MLDRIENRICPPITFQFTWSSAPTFTAEQLERFRNGGLTNAQMVQVGRRIDEGVEQSSRVMPSLNGIPEHIRMPGQGKSLTSSTEENLLNRFGGLPSLTRPNYPTIEYLLNQEQSSLDALKSRLETEGMAGVISVVEASHYKPAEPERTWYGNVRTQVVESVSRAFPSMGTSSSPSDSVAHHMGSELYAQSYIDEKIEDGSWLSMSQSQRESYQRDKFLEWKEKSDRAVGEHLAGKVGEALSYIPEKVGEAITHLMETAGSRAAVARDTGQAVTDVGEWIGFGFGAATTKLAGQSGKLASTLKLIRKRETIQTSTGTKVIHKVVGVEKTQIHHILSDKNDLIVNHPLVKKVGFDLKHDSVNKMLLPTVEGAEKSTSYRSVHQGRHVKKYNEDLAEEMSRAHEKGMRGNWPVSRYREELEKIISTARQKLKNGEIELNKNTREALGLPIKGDK